ncbi:AAA-like domain-containing protein [Desulfonatronovibrio magnus]|uniref:AAA-like domain-containing protein n=1 Tax=Desulfonatronovibrio magnus TaxID=698827 RepID=UPI0006966B82|nr:AAA-like domain-containing protein [Desulfonatronovibrio magnus]
MRYFHSYGPVDCEEHFCVARTDLVQQCVSQLVANPEKSGHYFTIWAPRQCGKTWLMRQARLEIEHKYGDRFLVGMMSMQGVVFNDPDSPDEILPWFADLFEDALGIRPDPPDDWQDWTTLFRKSRGIFSKPLILFIDEFDSLPPKAIDRLVTMFRNMYLQREAYALHGLALIGVRALLGVDSDRGSPFNVQRSLHVPRFTREEVEDLFGQYQSESGQSVTPEVVQNVYGATLGQPGLVCWFGELLTTKYNPGPGMVIDRAVWSQTYRRACFSEWNNTVLNLLKKARGQYQQHVLELFTRSDIQFSIDVPWCSYLYLNGIIDRTEVMDDRGETLDVCRFASPFIQQRLYNALTRDLMGEQTPILALEPLDDLADVFSGPELDLPALLERYTAYLNRLKAAGRNPCQDQPRRSDLHYTEYVGHFHLYFWLQNAVQDHCIVSPEFPTGNGRVDLHLKCPRNEGGKEGVIEVKSYINQAKMHRHIDQAANYARNLGLPSITLALFVPVEDEAVLAKLSGTHEIEGVRVMVKAIGWV